MVVSTGWALYSVAIEEVDSMVIAVARAWTLYWIVFIKLLRFLPLTPQYYTFEKKALTFVKKEFIFHLNN